MFPYFKIDDLPTEKSQRFERQNLFKVIDINNNGLLSILEL